MPGMAYFGSIYFGQEPFASTGGSTPVVIPPAPAVISIVPMMLKPYDPDEELILTAAAELLLFR